MSAGQQDHASRTKYLVDAFFLQIGFLRLRLRASAYNNSNRNAIISCSDSDSQTSSIAAWISSSTSFSSSCAV